MRKSWVVAAALLLAAVFSSRTTTQNTPPVVPSSRNDIAVVKPSAAEIAPGATTSNKGPAEKGQISTGRSSNRETWVVKAVRKTRNSIVTMKVVKKTSRKETVGTGVIIDERGYIVTNKHVIANAVEVRVVLSD